MGDNRMQPSRLSTQTELANLRRIRHAERTRHPAPFSTPPPQGLMLPPPSSPPPPPPPPTNTIISLPAPPTLSPLRFSYTPSVYPPTPPIPVREVGHIFTPSQDVDDVECKPTPSTHLSQPTEYEKNLLLEQIRDLFLLRAPDLGSALQSYLGEIRQHHWWNLNQVLRVVREALGPFPGESFPVKVNHLERVRRYLHVDCRDHPAGGRDVAKVMRRYLPPGREEEGFLRVQQMYGVAESAGCGLFVVETAEAVWDVYRRKAPEKMGHVAALLDEAGERGASQLLRAAVEKYEPELLSAGPSQAARLKAFCRRHAVPFSSVFPFRPERFEEKMLRLVVNVGSEPKDIKSFELQEPPHVTVADGPTPMM